jgi:hypothetical protein
VAVGQPEGEPNPADGGSDMPDTSIVWPPTGPPAPNSEAEMQTELERIARVVVR